MSARLHPGPAWTGVPLADSSVATVRANDNFYTAQPARGSKPRWCPGLSPSRGFGSRIGLRRRRPRSAARRNTLKIHRGGAWAAGLWSLSGNSGAPIPIATSLAATTTRTHVTQADGFLVNGHEMPPTAACGQAFALPDFGIRDRFHSWPCCQKTPEWRPVGLG